MNLTEKEMNYLRERNIYLLIRTQKDEIKRISVQGTYKDWAKDEDYLRVLTSHHLQEEYKALEGYTYNLKGYMEDLTKTIERGYFSERY